MTLDDFCTELEAKMAGKSGQDLLEQAVAGLCQVFTVKPEEVAIFLYDQGQEILEFAWPARLRPAGSIPLSSQNSLVARTAHDKKGTLNNSFATTPHASIFEFVKLDQERLNFPFPIQKIMSAPLLVDGAVTGVIQISRKGENTATAGKDFTSNDLAALNRFCQVIAPHLSVNPLP